MIVLRVLARRAWPRESATRLFSTTISYRGETDYVVSDGGSVGDVTEKSCECADARRMVCVDTLMGRGTVGMPAESEVEEVDIGTLPV